MNKFSPFCTIYGVSTICCDNFWIWRCFKLFLNTIFSSYVDLTWGHYHKLCWPVALIVTLLLRPSFVGQFDRSGDAWAPDIVCILTAVWRVKMSVNAREQCVTIKFCVCQHLKSRDIWQRLVHVHRRNTYSLVSVHRWVWCFESSNNSTSDKPCSGCPSVIIPALIHQVCNAVIQTPTISVAQLAEQRGTSVGTIHKILKKRLGWRRRRPARWVPHLLNQAQKQRRVDVCHTLLRLNRANASFLSNLIMMDESWFWIYDPQSRQACSGWLAPGAARPQKPRLERAMLKVMLTIFWDLQGMVMREFIEDSRGITAQVHLQLLRRLREKVRCQHPQVWINDTWRIQQDNAPAHRARVVQEWMRNMSTGQVPHPGYSPGLAPSNYWLFNRIKHHLRGHRYDSVQDLCDQIDRIIQNIRPNEFRHAIESLPDCWHHCVRAGGAYFEWTLMKTEQCQNINLWKVELKQWSPSGVIKDPKWIVTCHTNRFSDCRREHFTQTSEMGLTKLLRYCSKCIAHCWKLHTLYSCWWSS